ncbi:zinc ribbon domain-containing protein [Anaerococcus sp. Marseille-P3915]|uniref:zinc ribbon domain-containing protein n=1 Tax=Anaerococcus sp. Marseille-P3915 TaxID=2057799 RepID=UPI000D0B533F|nr:zinc ribbon domain-containing protein [Anaerococcus sp. Marseille-P3915]
MFCKNCGAELKPGANFCAQCGSPVDQEKIQPASEKVELNLDEKKEEFSEKFDEKKQEAAERLEEVGKDLGEKAEKVKESVEESLDTAKENIEDTAQEVKETAQKAEETLDQTVEDIKEDVEVKPANNLFEEKASSDAIDGFSNDENRVDNEPIFKSMKDMEKDASNEASIEIKPSGLVKIIALTGLGAASVCAILFAIDLLRLVIFTIGGIF